MSNIGPTQPNPNPIPPKLQTQGAGDSPETIAASVAASQAAAINLQAFKNELISVYGDKIGNTAFEAISAEVAKGKDLSFAMVRSAVEAAFAKESKTMSEADLTFLAKKFSSGGSDGTPKYEIDYSALSSWKMMYMKAMSKASQEIKDREDRMSEAGIQESINEASINSKLREYSDLTTKYVQENYSPKSNEVKDKNDQKLDAIGYERPKHHSKIRNPENKV